jgi:hypothetical protein
VRADGQLVVSVLVKAEARFIALVFVRILGVTVVRLQTYLWLVPPAELPEF